MTVIIDLPPAIEAVNESAAAHRSAQIPTPEKMLFLRP